MGADHVIIAILIVMLIVEAVSLYLQWKALHP
jgi:hypothetical protein